MYLLSLHIQPLFVPQGFHGIDAGGSPDGDESREAGNEAQCEGRTGEDQRIPDADFKEHRV